MRSALLLVLMINTRGCSCSTAKPAATPNTLDLLESALDEIASITELKAMYIWQIATK
jgi:hypothetical protein